MTFADIAGWVGAAALLAGYALVSTGRIAASVRFQVLNLAGSAGLGVNGAAHRAWPSVALNVAWMAIGIVTLARVPRRSRTRCPRRPA